MLIPEARRKEGGEILERIARGEKIEHFETVRRRKDGSPVEVSLSISPVRDASGAVVGASKIARDITQARRSERRQAALAELSKINTQPLDFSRRLESIPGLLVSGFADWCVIDLVRPPGAIDRAIVGHRDPARTAWARGRLVPLELDPSAPTGGPRVVRSSRPEIYPELGEEGLQAIAQDPAHLAFLREIGASSALVLPMRSVERNVGALILARCRGADAFDPADLEVAQVMADRIAMSLDAALLHQKVGEMNQELEERVRERTRELERTVQELETFSYTIAHDLRAPLRSMRGFGEVLLDDHGSRLGPDGRDCAQRIVKAAERMDALTRDLLAYGRVAQSPTNLENLDLDQVVGEVLSSIDPEVRATCAVIEIPRPLGRARGTRLLLSQAVANLISNACKFVEPGQHPRVEVVAEASRGGVRLVVVDQGIGIEDRHRAKLFGMFERLEPNRFPGNGIGLAIVRKAAERMGGRVGVESSPGKGSRFWIELPAALEEASA